MGQLRWVLLRNSFRPVTQGREKVCVPVTDKEEDEVLKNAWYAPHQLKSLQQMANTS